MSIKVNRLGVPYLDLDGEIIPLSGPFAGDLVAAEFANPGTLDALFMRIKHAVETFTGIDARMDDREWGGAFNDALFINEFTGPLNTLAEARRQVAAMTREEAQ